MLHAARGLAARRWGRPRDSKFYLWPLSPVNPRAHGDARRFNPFSDRFLFRLRRTREAARGSLATP